MKRRVTFFADKFTLGFLRLGFTLAAVVSVFSGVTAQISITAGGNCSFVRNHHLLEHQQPVFGYRFGPSLQVKPLKNFQKLSVQTEFLLNQKGYQLYLDKTYFIRFNYASFSIITGYAPVAWVSINAGAEFSGLLSTNVEKGTDTYRNFDVGMVFGFTFLDQKQISLYARATIGITPTLDYYSFDKLGNFTGAIHDLRNTCFSLGIKIKLFDNEMLK